MSIHIKLANTPKLMDEVFKIRHKVFSETEELIKQTEDKRLIDRFDTFSTSSDLVVMVDDKVVGAMRISLDCEVGLPADEYYDFRVHLPKDAYIMHIGMFCVTKEYRSPRVTMDLMLMATYFGKSNGVTHVVAPINPQIAKLLQRVGFEAVGKEFTKPFIEVPILPLVLEVNKLKDFFLKFVRKNRLQDFLGDYERSFYKKGESIITAGEHGTHAYLIIEGNAEVQLPQSNETIATLKEGEIFGELALLTDEVRSAHVVAITDLQVMTLSKAIFIKYFYNKPEQAQKLLKLMGRRTQTLITQLEDLKYRAE
ncbi:MAG: cyclic nucleotide-binding domain-containing protein [Sulfurovum sp.]